MGGTCGKYDGQTKRQTGHTYCLSQAFWEKSWKHKPTVEVANPTSSCGTAWILQWTNVWLTLLLRKHTVMWLTILPNSGLQIIMTQNNIITLESFTKLAVYVCQELIVWGSKLSPVFYKPLNEQQTMRTILPEQERGGNNNRRQYSILMDAANLRV